MGPVKWRQMQFKVTSERGESCTDVEFRVTSERTTASTLHSLTGPGPASCREEKMRIKLPCRIRGCKWN